MKISLVTLADASEQEVFDRVAWHLLMQGRKSMNSEYCRYRNEDGLSCAVGCLMSDLEYQPTFEGRSWTSLVDRGLVPKAHKELLNCLQILHDSQPVHQWMDYLYHLAKEFRLSDSVIKRYENDAQRLKRSA